MCGGSTVVMDSPSKTHFHWPNTKHSVTISKAVKTMQSPKADWKQYKIRIMMETDSLEKAKEKAAIAEETSDMASEISDTEVGKSGKRKRAAINYFPDQFDFVYHDLQPITKVKATEPILLQPPSIPLFLSSSLHISTSTTSQDVHWSVENNFKSLSANNKKAKAQRISSNTADIYNGAQYQREKEYINEGACFSSQPSDCALYRSPNCGSFDQDLLPKPLRHASTKTTGELQMERLFRSIEELKVDVSLLKVQEQEILNRLGKKNANVEKSLPDGVNLPIESWQQMEILEARLRKVSSGSVMQQMLVSYLGVIGGANIKDTTRRVLTALITNVLACELNFMGHGKKHAFSVLMIRKIVNDAVRINPLTKKATDAEVEDVVKDWLRNAKDRSQGRAKRGRLEFELNEEVEIDVEE